VLTSYLEIPGGTGGEHSAEMEKVQGGESGALLFDALKDGM
jgi:hypothetical protein